MKKLVESLHLPGIDHPLAKVGRVTAAEVSDSTARVAVELGFPAEGVKARWREFIADAVKSETGAGEVDVALTFAVTAHGVQPNLKPLPEVRNIIAVSSGKGGVGNELLPAGLQPLRREAELHGDARGSIAGLGRRHSPDLAERVIDPGQLQGFDEFLDT